MKQGILISFLFLCFCWKYDAHAQALTNLRQIRLVPQQETIKLDSIPIVDGSLRVFVNDSLIPETAYSVRLYNAEIQINTELIGVELLLTYRVFNFDWAKQAYHKNGDLIKLNEEGFVLNPFRYEPEFSALADLKTSGLDYSGSLMRGISFGNNQDVILNSSLNLQLGGYITPDIEVLAALTDENIPIQPEGNTQNIQEFDKIFIQIKLWKNHLITAGDIDLAAPESSFMKFTRKQQGLKYEGFWDLKNFGKLKPRISGSVARGIFARNQLSITDGNQGPYKLKGNNGESFLIVLSGSERVYLNGEQLVRGETNDYVIDYNLGEIKFTPKRIITQDMRINVEFIYTERSYTRTVFQLGSDYQMGNFTVSADFYNEQDSKNQPIQELTQSEKNVLSQIGDSTQNAYANGIKTVNNQSSDRILYEIRDTLISGALYDSILVYSTNDSITRYVASFTNVGAGKGNYILASSSANGRVYAWVPPLGGIPQGSYEPIYLLVAPNRKQMTRLKVVYDDKKQHRVSVEAAYSNNDNNLFSAKDNQFHNGIAGDVKYVWKKDLKSDKEKKWQLNSSLQYDFVQKQFSFIERYRALEFNRDWNLSSEPNANQHFAMAKFSINRNDGSFVEIGAQSLILEKQFQAYNVLLNASYKTNEFNLSEAFSYLHTTSLNEQTDFIRPKLNLRIQPKALKGWYAVLDANHEINMRKGISQDTLSANSYLWQNYQFMLHNADSAKNEYGFNYLWRLEHGTESNSFGKASFQSQNYNLFGSLLKNPKQFLAWTLTYRRSLQKDTIINAQSANFYLGRINYRAAILKGMIKTDVSYETGSGKEYKTEFSYVEAPNGQGQYAYDDLNNDGIKTLDEYYVSVFPDQNRYIKIYSNTTELVSVFNTVSSLSLSIEPRALIKQDKKWKKFISRFAWQTSLQNTNKIYDSGGNSALKGLNPLPFGIDDTALVSNITSSRNTLYFNRLSAFFGAEAHHYYQASKSLLTNGFETRKLKKQGIALRITPVNFLECRLAYDNGVNSLYSQFFAQRRYTLLFNEIKPDFSFIIKKSLRIKLGYEYNFISNAEKSTKGQFLVKNDMNIEFKYNWVTKGQIRAGFSYVSMAYTQGYQPNAQVDFAILQGLESGKNYLWNLSADYSLSANIQLSLGYDGRKTGTSNKIVHTGTMQLRATF